MPHKRNFLAPLNLAAYLTWLAIATVPLLTLAKGELTIDALHLAGLAGLLAVLILFLLREASSGLRQRQWLTLAQLPAALLSCAAFQEGLQPVLLILLAAQAASLFTARSTLLLMLVANAALLALLLAQKPLVAALVTALAYAGFQGFAVLTTQAQDAAQRARDEARRINAELLATRAMLAEGARAEERLHLSRELHDVAGHKLTALKLQLGLCAPGSDQAAAALAASRQLADELLAEVRGVVGALRAHDGVDLHSALAALAEGIPSPRITLALAADARPADFARAQALLRAAQEGITNALRHAGARSLHIALTRAEDGSLSLSVADDGCGMGSAAAGHGLNGLQERLSAVGGSLAVTTRPGGGSLLSARVPA